MSGCSVEGCEKPVKSLVSGMCGMHIERIRRNGTTELPDRSAPKCAVEGCERKHDAKGLCRLHYRRAKAGRPLAAPLFWVADTFEERVARMASGCWEWRGARTDVGYGTYRGKYAHRVSYERHIGPIPAGLVIDHLCRNRACVNPAHLEAVTNWTNTIARGTSLAALATRTNRCVRGHEFTPENTYWRPDGTNRRQCRECKRLREKARTRRKPSGRATARHEGRP